MPEVALHVLCSASEFAKLRARNYRPGTAVFTWHDETVAGVLGDTPDVVRTA